MNSEDISKLIEKELSTYKYEEPIDGTTYGKPWSEGKVLSYIPKLKKSLVKPYIMNFLLRETQEHFDNDVFEDYWIIAVDNGYIQWYDPKSQEYGLGIESKNGDFISIGVRGDLIGVYCAM